MDFDPNKIQDPQPRAFLAEGATSDDLPLVAGRLDPA
jgi:hypothetical protein